MGKFYKAHLLLFDESKMVIHSYHDSPFRKFLMMISWTHELIGCLPSTKWLAYPNFFFYNYSIITKWLAYPK